MTDQTSNPASVKQDDYPTDELIEESHATVKPDERVKCARCPNSEWIEEFKDTEYGTDTWLMAYCVALGGQWVWPKRQVIGCSARRKAIKAQRNPD